MVVNFVDMIHNTTRLAHSLPFSPLPPPYLIPPSPSPHLSPPPTLSISRPLHLPFTLPQPILHPLPHCPSLFIPPRPSSPPPPSSPAFSLLEAIQRNLILTLTLTLSFSRTLTRTLYLTLTLTLTRALYFFTTSVMKKMCSFLQLDPSYLYTPGTKSIKLPEPPSWNEYLKWPGNRPRPRL